eukprot:Opistho-1_new@103542
MKKLIKLAVALTLFIGTANAQTDKATTAKIVAEKNYVFVATMAIPLNSTDINNVLRQLPGNTGGGNINLNGNNYTVTITPDSIVSYLPYYGRSFSAPIGNDENGYKFKAKDFTYQLTKRKKGGWDVVIQSKDIKDNVRMNLNIGENGYATLNVISNNKQSITYNGYLSENKVEGN